MFFALSQPKPGQENQVNLWGVNAIEQLNIIPHFKPTSNQTLPCCSTTTRTGEKDTNI
jgi:hypothetical protein